jgi:hypothetical protein
VRTTSSCANVVDAKGLTTEHKRPSPLAETKEDDASGDGENKQDHKEGGQTVSQRMTRKVHVRTTTAISHSTASQKDRKVGEMARFSTQKTACFVKTIILTFPLWRVLCLVDVPQTSVLCSVFCLQADLQGLVQLC